jgi:hypothetical protein
MGAVAESNPVTASRSSGAPGRISGDQAFISQDGRLALEAETRRSDRRVGERNGGGLVSDDRSERAGQRREIALDNAQTEQIQRAASDRAIAQARQALAASAGDPSAALSRLADARRQLAEAGDNPEAARLAQVAAAREAQLKAQLSQGQVRENLQDGAQDRFDELRETDEVRARPFTTFDPSDLLIAQSLINPSIAARFKAVGG